MSSSNHNNPTYPRRFNDKISIGALTLGVVAFILSIINATSTPWGKKVNVYDHVMQTRTLRCAYIVDAPTITKDTKSDRPLGAAVDMTEQLAQQLDLKVTWLEEANQASMIKDLTMDRFDAICSGVIENPVLARDVLFTDAVSYIGLYAFARLADNRFDHSLDVINDHSVKIIAPEDTLSMAIAKQNYAKAELISKNKATALSDILETIADGKADIAFEKITTAKPYLDHHPGTLKALTKMPARAFPVSLIVLNHGETDFAEAVNATLRTLQEDGTIERILRKYDPNFEQTLLLAKPYQSHDKYIW